MNEHDDKQIRLLVDTIRQIPIECSDIVELSDTDEQIIVNRSSVCKDWEWEQICDMLRGCETNQIPIFAYMDCVIVTFYDSEWYFTARYMLKYS